MTASLGAIILSLTVLLSAETFGVESFAAHGTRHAFHRRSLSAKDSEQRLNSAYGHYKMNTSRRYSDVIDRPSDSSFEERMRKLVQGQRSNVTVRGSNRNSMRPRNVQEVSTLEEYKNAVASVTDKLVVVRFYAKWCKACKAVAPAFYRMAKDYENEAVFVEVPVTEDNANVHQGLGVPSIPFGHIYHPEGGLVEELRLVRKQFPRFHKTFETYLSGSCDLPDGDCTNPYEDKREPEPMLV